MYTLKYPLLALSLLAPQVLALTSDQDQPITINADTAEIDNDQGITIYRGNVVLTRGSVRMTGNKMTVYFVDDTFDKLIMEGQPAFYQQLPDESAAPDQAAALRMEYYESEDRIVLIERASFSRENLNFTADRIEYDMAQSKVIATSDDADHGDADADTAKERVKVILKPDRD